IRPGLLPRESAARGQGARGRPSLALIAVMPSSAASRPAAVSDGTHRLESIPAHAPRARDSLPRVLWQPSLEDHGQGNIAIPVVGAGLAPRPRLARRGGRLSLHRACPLVRPACGGNSGEARKAAGHRQKYLDHDGAPWFGGMPLMTDNKHYAVDRRNL